MIKKDKLLAILAVGVQYIGMLVLFKLLASKLDNTTFAEYMLFIAAANLLLGLPFTAVQQAIIRFAPGMGKEHSQQVMAIAVSQAIIAVLFIMLLITLLQFIPSLASFMHSYHAMAALAFTSSEAIKLYVLAYENALQNRKSYLCLTFFEYASKVSLTAILLMFNFADLLHLVFILITCNVLVVLYSVKIGGFEWSINGILSQLRTKLSLQILLFSLPVACWSIFGWLRDMSGRYIIEALLTKQDVAAFSVLATLTSLIPGFVNSVVGNYYIPIVYANHNSGKRAVEKSINTIVLAMLIFSALAIVIIVFMSDFFVATASSAKYEFVAQYLPYTLAAYFAFCIAMIATTELYAKGAVNCLFLPNVISGILGSLAFYFFISKYGFNGAIGGYVVSYISYALSVFLLLFYSRLSKQSMA